MNKFLNWVGGIFAFAAAVFFASRARSYKQKSDATTEREVNQLTQTKKQNLAKAEKLGKKAQVQFNKAKDAKEKSEAMAAKVENSDASTSLADRVRDFNNGL